MAEGSGGRCRDEGTGDCRQIKDWRRGAGIAAAVPQDPRSPDGESEREGRSNGERDLRSKPRIGKDSDGDEHRRDANEPHETTLDRILELLKRLFARVDPFGRIKSQHERPNDAGDDHQGFADDGRQLPNARRDAPCAAQAREAQNDPEKRGGHGDAGLT